MLSDLFAMSVKFVSIIFFFVDDITLFSPNLTGLQELVDVCYDYTLSLDIMFMCNKSRGMLFTPNHFNLSCTSPVLLLVNRGYT